MNELDLEDLESRLYSQVYHSVNDEIEATNTHQNSGESLTKPTSNMKKSGGRYFGPWSPASKFHKNTPPRTPGRRDDRQEGFYNKSIGKSRTPEISINQVVVVTPTQPIVYMNAKERNRARRKLRTKEKLRQKRAMKALKASTPVKQPEEEDVITLSDSEDDSCVLVDNKWPMLSVADSDDEKEAVSEENKEKPINHDNTTELSNEQESTLNESLSDDVIFVEPVVTSVDIINLDEETETNKDKHSETASSTSSDNLSINNSPTKISPHKIHQERKELLRTPDSTSNDFMNHSGVELNQSNFNFSLHGLDFNNREFLKPAPPNETCETESSSSTTDINSVNLMKTIVFNEVDFPKEDIFSENNLESFGNFITPLRNNTSVTSLQSSPLKLPEAQNKNVYSSDSSENEFEESQKDVAPKLKNLPELSPMQAKQKVASPAIVKKSKKISSMGSKYDLINTGGDTSPKDVKFKNSKKKKKNKKKRSVNEENLSNLGTSVAEIAEDAPVEEDLKKKKRKSSQMENAEDGESQPKKRSFSINNDDSIKGSKSDDRLALAEDLDSSNIDNKKDIDDRRSMAEVTPSVVTSEEITDENMLTSSVVDRQTPVRSINSKVVPDEKHKEIMSEAVQVQNIKTENDFEEETLQKPKLPTSPLDGLVVVEEVFAEHNTLVESSDVESVLSPLHEQSDIQLNFEESKSDEKVCLAMEFGKDLNNFSVADLQLEMSSDPKLWTILESDRSPSRKNRGRRCNRCKQFGHVGIRCTNRVEAKCSLCGGRGHYEPRCPHKLCTQCGQRSPYSTTYCNSCFKFRNFRCQVCSMTGHLPNTCPDLWRRYHLTTAEGPLTSYNGPPLKEKNQLWCSGCARSGHLEHSCRFYKSIYPPTDPFIKSYEQIYKEETRQQEPLRYSQPSNYQTTNQLYQPIGQRPEFAGNYAQNPHINYNQINPQYVNPFMDGVFVANQQNFYPPMATNILQYPQNNYPANHNQFVFDNVLPTFISLNSDVPSNNSYQEISQVKCDNRYVKSKTGGKTANSMFCSSTAPQLRHFVSEELHRLTKISLVSNKLVQEMRKGPVPRDYEMLNMLLFGVFNLRDGKMHLERLKRFSWTKKSKVDGGTRRRMHKSYCYIFGRDGHPDVDYNELLRIV